MARRNQPVTVTPFTLAGAMAPVTLAGALAQQNAEALAGIAFIQIVNPGAPVMYGGFTSNVDMKSWLARVWYARKRQGHADRRAARPPLSPAVPLLQRQRIQCTRRPGGVRIADDHLAGHTGPRQPPSPWPRLARRRAHRLVREVHHRCGDPADDGGVPAATDRDRGRPGPGRHTATSARAGIFSGRRTPWHATNTPSTGRFCRTGATSRPGSRTARWTPRNALTGCTRNC